MIGISIQNVSKSYTPGKPVLQPLSLEIAPGELFFLLGPSGCGKSTLLRIIAGFLAPDAGRIAFNGRDVTDLAPEAREAPMVFQNYALWPHLTVYENVAFGLKAHKLPAAEVKKRAMEALEVVKMQDFADRKAPLLSGGQQQRVALARALAVAPGILLLDEPLSNLDAQLRDLMREELRDICRARQLTAVYVTHDRREALSMADRMAVLHNGRIAQLGKPAELYRHPANHFVAAFLGDANFLSGTVTAPGCVQTEYGGFSGLDTGNRTAGSKVELFVRPECISIQPAADCANIWRARLTGGSYLGEFASWRFGGVMVSEIAPGVRTPGVEVTLGVRAQDVVVLDAESSEK